MTAPPFTPVYAIVNNGSAATFKPTCFMHAIVLTPAYDAPATTSSATFSFGAHSVYTSGYFAAYSLISVDGVPGYADITLPPASYIPLATASFPSIIFFIISSIYVLFYLLFNYIVYTILFSQFYFFYFSSCISFYFPENNFFRSFIPW